MPYNARQYNSSIPYDTEGGGPTGRLVSQLIGIQDRKNQQARQAELDRIAEEDRKRQNQQQDEERSLKVADLLARVAAAQDRPKEKAVDVPMPVGAPLTPQDQADIGEPSAVESAQEIKLQAQQPAVPVEMPTPTPTQHVSFAGQDVEIPLFDRGETQARADEDFKRKLMQEGQLAEARDVDVTIPDDPKYGALAGITVPKTVAAVILRGAQKSTDPFANYKGVAGGYLELGPDGRAQFRDTTPPASTSGGEKGSWVTRAEDNKRVWVSDTQRRTAPEGMFSDVRPTSSSIRKADPAKLKMARAALGGPDVPNSLWDLATKINNDPSMMGAITGAVRAGAAENFPRLSSRQDPKARLYISQIKGFASSIAKAFGESGVLTNQDIQRAMDLFPIIGEDPALSLDKLKRVKAVMDAGMTSDDFRAVFGRDPSPAGGGGVGGGVDESGPRAPANIDPEVQRRLNRYR